MHRLCRCPLLKFLNWFIQYATDIFCFPIYVSPYKNWRKIKSDRKIDDCYHCENLEFQPGRIFYRKSSSTIHLVPITSRASSFTVVSSNNFFGKTGSPSTNYTDEIFLSFDATTLRSELESPTLTLCMWASFLTHCISKLRRW